MCSCFRVVCSCWCVDNDKRRAMEMRALTSRWSFPQSTVFEQLGRGPSIYPLQFLVYVRSVQKQKHLPKKLLELGSIGLPDCESILLCGCCYCHHHIIHTQVSSTHNQLIHFHVQILDSYNYIINQQRQPNLSTCSLQFQPAT